MEFYDLLIPLIIGIVLDSFLGDPVWLPHPVRLFGWLISVGEKKLNAGNYKRLKGALMSVILICSIYTVFSGILWILSSFSIIKVIVSSVFVFYGIANHSLIKESLKVIWKLKKEGIEAAREQLSRIVGRDTNNLNENQIRAAVLETLSENLSDGVIAPLFYYFIGGIPLMFTYKMVNTLDSMIGYKNQRFKHFGWFAARFDDLANFIPARLTAILMVFVSFSKRGLIYIFKFGHKHTSPNAGYPEAALAGILNCQFGGTSLYWGKRVEKPLIGENSRNLLNIDIYKACFINVGSFMAMVLICLGIIVFFLKI